MNYIEIRVKKLLEQVLKGEKGVPIIEENRSVTEYIMKFGNSLYLYSSLNLNRNVNIQIIRKGSVVGMYDSNELKELCDKVARHTMFKKGEEFYIDKIFREMP